MITRLIPANSPDAIQQALAVLQAGRLVAFPTDTVYGLGALAHSFESIDQLYAAKERGISKAIPILIGDPADLERIAVDIHEMALRLAQHFWPGPLTLVLARHPALPENLSLQPTVGVRMPDHPVALALLRAAGPLAVTSANLSGNANTVTADEVLEQLGGRVGLILDGGRTPGGLPSTVVNCTGPDPVILRPGPISMQDILKATGLPPVGHFS